MNTFNFVSHPSHHHLHHNQQHSQNKFCQEKLVDKLRIGAEYVINYDEAKSVELKNRVHPSINQHHHSSHRIKSHVQSSPDIHLSNTLNEKDGDQNFKQPKPFSFFLFVSDTDNSLLNANMTRIGVNQEIELNQIYPKKDHSCLQASSSSQSYSLFSSRIICYKILWLMINLLLSIHNIGGKKC